MINFFIILILSDDGVCRLIIRILIVRVIVCLNCLLVTCFIGGCCLCCLIVRIFGFSITLLNSIIAFVSLLNAMSLSIVFIMCIAVLYELYLTPFPSRYWIMIVERLLCISFISLLLASIFSLLVCLFIVCIFDLCSLIFVVLLSIKLIKREFIVIWSLMPFWLVFIFIYFTIII